MKNLFYYSIVIVLFVSCQNNTILEDTISHEISTKSDQLYFIPDTSSFAFTYEGKMYVYGENKNDKNVALRKSDLNGNTLYQELMQKENLCTVVKDGNLEIYNSLQEFMDINTIRQGHSSIKSPNNIQLRASKNAQLDPRIYLYENEFYIKELWYDESADLYLNSDNGPIFPQYKKTLPSYYQNKTNSFSFFLQVYGDKDWAKTATFYLVLFEGADFSGQTLVYNPSIIHFTYLYEPQLSKFGWGNRIRSYLFMATLF